MAMKVCPSCKENKDLSDYYNQKRAKDGKHSWCKSCMTIASKRWIKNNPEAVKKQRKILQRRKNYKITEDEFQSLKSKCNNKCMICNQSERIGTELCVDHCHTTKKIRGLLCRNCNAGLGQFKDNIDLLSKAIKYLKKRGI